MLASEPSEKTQTQFASKYFKYVDLVNQLGQDLKIGSLSSTIVELSNLVLKDFVDQSTLKSNTLYCDIASPYIISAITQDRGNVESLSGYRLSAGMKTAFSEANGDIKKIVPSLSAVSKIAEANQLITGITTENGQIASIQTTGLSSIISSLGSSTRSTTSEDYAITSITTQNGNVSDIGERKLDKVEVEATQQDGVEIARISVNNDVKILFAPKYTFDYNVKELSNLILSGVQEAIIDQITNVQKFVGSFTITTAMVNRMVDLREYFQLEPSREYFLRISFRNFSTTALKPALSAYTNNKRTLSRDLNPCLTSYVSHVVDGRWKGNPNSGYTTYPANFYTTVTSERCLFAINNVNANAYVTFALYKFDDHTLTPDMLGSNECSAVNENGYQQQECLATTLPAFAFNPATSYAVGNSSTDPSLTQHTTSVGRLPADLMLSGITDFQRILWSKYFPAFTHFANQFAYCKDLTSISAIGLSSFYGVSAFTNCIYLKNVVFLDVVRAEAKYAFWNCQNLSCVEMPKLQIIDDSDYMFAGPNFGLRNIKFQSLSSIRMAPKMLANCAVLSSVEFPELQFMDNTCQNMFCNCTALSSIEFPKLSSLGNRSVSYQLFENCMNLRELSMPNLSDDGFPKSWKTNKVFDGCTLPISIYIQNVNSIAINDLPNAVPRGSTIVCKDKTITTT